MSSSIAAVNLPKKAPKAKGKLAKTMGAYKANEVIGSKKRIKPAPTHYENEKIKIKHFYKLMDDVYSLILNYDSLLNKIEKEKQVAANSSLKGVTFTL